MDERYLWFWLSNIPGIGNLTIHKLLEYFETPYNIYTAKEEVAWLTSTQKNALLLSKKDDRIKRQYERMQKTSVRFVNMNQEEYPKQLLQLVDYPIGIYVQGKLPNSIHPSIAIVGARGASDYGREMAEYFAKSLAKSNVQIISGLASGVDSFAHKGTLSVNGYTLGVLGGGINVIYPKENYRLYMQMQNEGGLLSESGLDVKPVPGLFPRRNRLISMLADGILVIEAREKSGSLITVDCGLEQGKDIFALPGRNIDPLSKGCNNLIKQGAQCVTSPEDILETLGIAKLQENKEEGLIQLT